MSYRTVCMGMCPYWRFLATGEVPDSCIKDGILSYNPIKHDVHDTPAGIACIIAGSADGEIVYVVVVYIKCLQAGV